MPDPLVLAPHSVEDLVSGRIDFEKLPLEVVKLIESVARYTLAMIEEADETLANRLDI